MKKTFKIEVDCANCANLVEGALKNVKGINDVNISFMTQKMKIDFEDGVDIDNTLAEAMKVAKAVEPDFEIL